MFQIGDRVKHWTYTDYLGTVDKITLTGDVLVHWDCGVYVDYPETWLVKIKETTTMDNPFIETVTKKTLKSAYYDGEAIGYADLAIEVRGEGKVIDLVVGSTLDQATSCFFTKKTLGNLLKILQEVHDLMED